MCVNSLDKRELTHDQSAGFANTFKERGISTDHAPTNSIKNYLDTENRTLDRVYNYLENTGALGGDNTLLKEVRLIDRSLKRDDVKKYLEGQHSHKLHKPVK